MFKQNSISKKILKWIVFPFSILFVAFPNLIKNLVFLFFRRSIKLLRPKCIFLINPSSGQKFGFRLIQILKELHREDSAISLFEPTVFDFLKSHLNSLSKGEKLIIVICGGDGSMNSIVDLLEQKLPSLSNCVFVPMPIGTGNDLSQVLNFGCKMSIDFLHEYFQKLNSPKTNVVKMDVWNVTYENQTTGQTIKRKMLLYLGFGYDGRIVRVWDAMRKKFKFLFVSNVSLLENQQTLLCICLFLHCI